MFSDFAEPVVFILPDRPKRASMLRRLLFRTTSILGVWEKTDTSHASLGIRPANLPAYGKIRIHPVHCFIQILGDPETTCLQT